MDVIAWTDPSTHVWATGEIVQASSMNTFIKDNLIDLDRRTTITSAKIDTSEGTSSTTYTNLATVGPAVSVTIGSTGLALVTIYAHCLGNTTGIQNYVGVTVSGATSAAADDGYALVLPAVSTTFGSAASATFLAVALVAGSNTFTLKYRTQTGGFSSTFSFRKLSVTPLGS